MASYRPYLPPPHSTFPRPPPPPNQNPPAPPSQSRGNQYSQNWGYGNSDGSSYAQQSYYQTSNYQHAGYASSSSQQHFTPPLNQIPQPPKQHHQYAQQPLPPPPSDSSYPPPPPPPAQPAPPVSMYYPSSHYSQYTQHQPLQPQPQPPPPLPSSPPPSSTIPPPPPPSEPPPPPPPPSSAPSLNQSNERPAAEKGPSMDERKSVYVPSKQHRPPVPPLPVKKANLPPGRVETEEERRLRKKRESEKHRQQMKESQNKVLQKTQMLASGVKGHGSISGSHLADRRTTPLLTGERTENRLKKPTTFLCKLKFRNELPDPTAQPKLLSLGRDKDRFTNYTITSLEKMHKPQLYVEPDLGIPLDLLDLSIYNPPKGERIPLDAEDEDLLRDDDPVTPIKKDGIKRKERPTDKGVSWLVKTQYISPLSMESTKQSLTEKQAKVLREKRGSHNILEDLNNRERQLQEIEASFESCKSRPIHAENRRLQPVKVQPLFPDFDRYKDQFVVSTFDSAPTADSETYGKLDKTVRDSHESQAIMKSFVATSSDAAKPDKFLAYMVPAPDELTKDMFDDHEDISYTWVREYQWDVRGDDADDPTTYLVTLDESEARYMTLPTKLVLRKKRARDGKSNSEVEHFPVPSRVTVRKRPTVSVIELKEEDGGYSASKGAVSGSKRARISNEDDMDQRQDSMHDDDPDQSSGAEYEMSD